MARVCQKFTSIPHFTQTLLITTRLPDLRPGNGKALKETSIDRDFRLLCVAIAFRLAQIQTCLDSVFWSPVSVGVLIVWERFGVYAVEGVHG